jgi:hypothetical protein
MKQLLGIMSGLNISDGLFTDYAVNNEIVKEANSLMKAFVFGGDFVLLKIAGAILCSLALWLVYKRFPRTALAATSFIVLVYSVVLTLNIVVFTVN